VQHRGAHGRWVSAETWRRHVAGVKSWKTRRAREEFEAAFLEHLKRVEAGYKSWRTRRRREAERKVPPAPVLPPERITYQEIIDLPKSEISPDTTLDIDVDFGGGSVYRFDGWAEDFDHLDFKRGIDNWAEENDLGSTYKSPFSWRAPGVRLFLKTADRAPDGTQTAIKVRALPDAVKAMSLSATGPELALDEEPEEPGPREWKEQDALPE